MADFKQAFELLKRWENRITKNGIIVYSNIEGDNGGETVLGVARNINGHLALWEDVDKIKNEVGTKDLIKLSKKILDNKRIVNDIEVFYKINYWYKSKCDLIQNQAFASNLFLLSVNAGVKRGVKVGQEACGITADGIIGKMTKAKWMAAGDNEAKKFTEIEIKYYKSIVDKNESQRKFLKGWLNRANAI